MTVLIVFGTLIIILLILLLIFPYLPIHSNNENETVNSSSFHAFDSIGARTMGSDMSIIPMNTVTFIDNSTFSSSEDGESVTILKDGSYEISYHVQFETQSNQGGELSTLQTRLVQDQARVDGSAASCFLKKQANGNLSSGCGATVLLHLTESPVTIQVVAHKATGTTASQTKQNESSVTIQRL